MMQVITQIDDLAVCDDCLLALNGVMEWPDARAERAWEEAHRRMWPQPSEGYWIIDTCCDDDCGSWFSWQACDGCGSRLGGNRHPAVATKIR